MTIDELLEIAQTYTGYAAKAGDHDQFNNAGALAAVAHAAAATAQATILAQMTDTVERPGLSDRRILNVDTGN